MKKFLLLVLVFALIALPMVMAAPSITGKPIGDYCDPACVPPASCSEGVCVQGPWCCDHYCAPYQECESCQCIPEFTTIGMGLAVMGAGAGWALIRKKRK